MSEGNFSSHVLNNNQQHNLRLHYFFVLRQAHEECFQNLHYVERHEDHTIAHAIQASYKKTKVYLWPDPTQGGMKAGRTVQTILNLAGFKNVKSKVVGFPKSS
ncbi:putative ribosomal protein S5 [Helianthus debilis subsp. tardiflorus]